MKLMLGLMRLLRESAVDGRDLTTIDRPDAQPGGVVMQDESNFYPANCDNIAFFDPEIDMQRVIRAASAARIHKTIAAIR